MDFVVDGLGGSYVFVDVGWRKAVLMCAAFLLIQARQVRLKPVVMDVAFSNFSQLVKLAPVDRNHCRLV
jgi:hypothetical protein